MSKIIGKDYVYSPRVLVTDRMEEIRALVAWLEDDAAFDIEDKREIYEALRDLLTVVDRLPVMD